MSVSLICLGGSKAEGVRGGRSWVGGVVLGLDGKGQRSDHGEDES